MSVTWLVDEGSASRPVWVGSGGEHEVRRMGESGSPAGIVDYYARQAHTWAAWVGAQPGYYEPLARALALLAPPTSGLALEIASGSVPLQDALNTPIRLIATDASIAMLEAASPTAMRVACDSARLPFRSDAFDLVIGLNPVVVVPEALRVCKAGGWLVVGYSFGPHTPVYRSPEQLLEAAGHGYRCFAGRGVWGEFTAITTEP